MDMKTAEVDYQKRLLRFVKYRKQGVDLLYICTQCGKFVYQSDILYGFGCKKCGSRRVSPGTETLTKFGVKYCQFFNWIHEQINKRSKKIS